MNAVAGHDYHKGIPGWCGFEKMYHDAIATVTDDRPRTFVEIGCWQGRSAALMAQLIKTSGKQVQLVCIDPFDDGGPDLWNTTYYKELKAPLRELFDKHTAPYADIIKTVQLKSVDAADQFADHSIDFIMIDGDHTYEGVHADIEAYLPKMRPGSIMSGDDYYWPGVTRAANEFFSGRGLQVRGKAHPKDYKMSVAHWWVKLP